MSNTTALTEAPSDAELISRVRAGDRDAYGVLFERHSEAARRMARQLVRGPDIDDLVSEAFTKVFVILQRGSGPDVAFRAYLLTSIRRLHIDKARAGQRVQVTDDLEELDSDVEFADPATANFERGAAASAFASLPERWQLVLWHLEVEGQKPADIAPSLGMSANGVAALAYRAREGLRQAYLQKHLADTADDTCRWTTEHLGAYVRKGLAKRDSAKVQSHLDECRRCTAVYLELTEVNSNLAGILGPAILGAAAPGYLAATGGGAKVLVLLLTPWTKLKEAGAAVQSGVAAAAVGAVIAAAAVAQMGGDEPTDTAAPETNQPAPSQSPAPQEDGPDAPPDNSPEPQPNNNSPQTDPPPDDNTTPPDDDQQPPDEDAVPDAPIDVSGDVEGNEVSLSWSPVTDPNVRGYRVYREDTPVAASTTVVPAATTIPVSTAGASAAANDRGDLISDGVITETSFTDNTVVDGRQYEYLVTAVSDSGEESPVSRPERVTYDLIPAAPHRVRANERDAGIAIRWKPNSEPDLGSYQVLRDGQELGRPTTGTHLVDRDVTDGERYSYAVVAMDLGGKESEPSTEVDADYDPAPAAPSDLRADVRGNAIQLRWDRVPGPDTQAYKVFRDGEAIARTRAPKIVDRDVTDGETYSYSVAAIDRGGQRSEESDSVEATFDPAPESPTGLRAHATGNGIKLEWTAGSAPDLERYLILRDGAEIGASTSTRFTDTGVDDGAEYTYTIVAVDRSGDESGPSNDVSAAWDPRPDEPTGLQADAHDRDVTLSWDENAEPDIAGYRVYRNGHAVDDVAGTSFTDTNVPGSEAVYWVTALDRSDQESNRSESATADLPPGSPVHVVAVEGDASVDVSWSARRDDDVAGYVVLRDGVPISGTVGTPQFTDATAIADVRYRYTVVTVDRSGNQSDESSADLGSWQAPSQPVGLDWEMHGSSLTLSWSPNPESDLDHYDVWLDRDDLGPTTGTSAHQGGHTGTATHTLRVTAVDRNGNESVTAVLTFTHYDRLIRLDAGSTLLNPEPSDHASSPPDDDAGQLDDLDSGGNSIDRLRGTVIR